MKKINLNYFEKRIPVISIACFMFLVTEWISRREGTRDVIVHFVAERKLLTISLLNKQVLRSIDLKHVQVVEIQVSTGGNLHYVLVRIAREYDVVSTHFFFFN